MLIKGLYLTSLRKSKIRLSIIFLAPVLIIIGLIIIFPLVYTVGLSFLKSDILEPTKSYFAGIQNYIKSFQSEFFRDALVNSLVLTFSSVFIQMIIATLIAILLNVRMKGRGIVRSLYLMPWAIGSYIAAYIFRWMFDANLGMFNQILVFFGVVEKGIPWFTSTNLAMLSVIMAHVWKGLPWSTLVLLAGLQMVPKDLMDAGRVDGANFWQEFWYIVFPTIRYVYIVVFILRVIWYFNWFDFTWLLTGGGPSTRTLTLPIHVYKTAFLSFDAGRSSAVGVVMFVILIIFVTIFLKISSKEERL